MQLRSLFASTNAATICKEAREVFQFKPALLEELQKRTAGLPPIDIGVHVRMGDKIMSGEMKAIPLQAYIDAIHEAKTSLGKETVAVYIMTDVPACV
jgi:hypothetical protein